jgi:hypothetical protein
MENLEMIRQGFGKEGMSRTRKSKLIEIEKGETREEQSQEHAHRSFKRIVPGRPNSAYYRDVLWRLPTNVRRLRHEIWRQTNWLLHHDNAPTHASVFTTECLTKNISCRLLPTLLFSVSPIADETERSPF